MKKSVFVTVGTDVHPFDRLVEWVEQCREEVVSEGVEWIIQFGTSIQPSNCMAYPFIDASTMISMIRNAEVVICHGGPSTIYEVWRSGMRPIVVPRTRSCGEHVDDHQVRFARLLAEEGKIFIAEDYEAFCNCLTKALDDPQFLSFDIPIYGSTETLIPQRTLQNFIREVSPLIRYQK